MANPFEDPSVKQAAGGGAVQPSNVYGGGAYDDQTTQMVAKAANNMSAEQKQAVVAVGGQMASHAANQAADDLKSDYNQSMQTQQNAYAQPASPNWCQRCFMWLPIRYVAWLGGIALLAAIIIDWIINALLSFIYGIIAFYLLIFSIIVIFVESPVFALTRRPQLRIFYWIRLLSRMWGRAFVYIFMSFLTFTEIETTFTITFMVGIYFLVTALLMLIISRMAAAKYVRIFDFMIGGADPNNEEEIQGRIMRKFDELDKDKDERIGSSDIVQLGIQSGRRLSNAERHAIQTFLDLSCNGAVSKEDFVTQFMTHNRRQRFL